MRGYFECLTLYLLICQENLMGEEELLPPLQKSGREPG